MLWEHEPQASAPTAFSHEFVLIFIFLTRPMTDTAIVRNHIIIYEDYLLFVDSIRLMLDVCQKRLTGN